MDKKYLFDTNIISEYTRKIPNLQVVSLVEQNYKQACISSVTYFESLRGILSMNEGRRKMMFLDYFDSCVRNRYDIVPYDSAIADINASFFSVLTNQGKVPSLPDSMIAATALANNLILVTRNVKDFRYIQEVAPLKIENWFE